MVQIEGMEMPKSCNECKCLLDAYGNWFCGIEQFITTSFIKERHPKCPLREVKNDKNQ